MTTSEYYSPLCKDLQKLTKQYKDDGYAVLFIYRDCWGAVDCVGAKPGTSPWAVFDEASRKKGGGRLLIAFDLHEAFYRQMPQQFIETLETLDIFAVQPLINIRERTGTEKPVQLTLTSRNDNIQRTRKLGQLRPI